MSDQQKVATPDQSVWNKSAKKPQTGLFRTKFVRGAVESQFAPHLWGMALKRSFTVEQVAKAYHFPSDVSGLGQTIGLLELGGGYLESDLVAAGIDPSKVSFVSILGAENTFDGAEGDSGEVGLDIQIAAKVAPGAKIVCYFAPNTSEGFYTAVAKMIEDGVIMSCSWGAAEDAWTKEDLTNLDSILSTAKQPFFAAAGDNGSSDGEAGQHVDFPASSTHAIACGGTRLTVDVRLQIATETVWNDGAQGATGGGISSIFPAPAWQHGLLVTLFHGLHERLSTRGVPDVAGNADPVTGYQLVIGGERQVIGGTSAVAPLFAGLAALLAQKEGMPLPSPLAPVLYANKQAFHDIGAGNNGEFQAAKNAWDPCTGLGSPNGAALEKLLTGRGGIPAETHHDNRFVEVVKQIGLGIEDIALGAVGINIASN